MMKKFWCFILVWSVAISAVMADGDIRGFWNLDDGVGFAVSDASGMGNMGFAKNIAWEQGVRNAGVKFKDGGWINCGNASSLCPADAIALEAWVMPSQNESAEPQAILDKEGSYALRIDRAGRLSLILNLDGRQLELTSIQALVKNKWQHVAATFDGAKAVLYINGEQDAGKTVDGGKIAKSRSYCFIGSVNGKQPLLGRVDEVRVAGAALSVDEIQASYRRGLYEVERDNSRFTAFYNKDKKRDPIPVVPGFLWIDAEDFEIYGGWWMDTQFVPQMGSPYLLAAGIGTPVEDAVTTFDVQDAGTYRLWVRSKNWLKEHAPGTFKVSVNGRDSRKMFGAEKSGEWVWEDAGMFKLSGETRLTLADQTGFYGRCDAFILTQDLDYQPPNELQAYKNESNRLTGAFADVQTVGDYDVVVVGAGVAGCNAAIAAARTGAKTVLIQNRPMLGGNNSLEMGVPVLGPADYGKKNAREAGLNEEVGREQAFNFLRKWSAAAELVAAREPNLTVFVNTHVCDVEMTPDKEITAVKAFHMITGEQSRYTGRMFIDCTGDGWLGYYAGGEFMMGREAKDTFGESNAPEEADGITMSGSLMQGSVLAYQSGDSGKPVKHIGPEWLWDLSSNTKYLEARKHYEKTYKGGSWWHENQGEVDDLWDPEAARDGLIRVSLSYWNWIKNHSNLKEEALRRELQALPVTNARRETRRLVGDHIITQDEVLGAKLFEDRIAYGGWGLDIHHPKGIFSTEGPFDYNTHTPLYHVPYRILYSKNVPNLLFAGRHVSCTHVALGTLRVQATTGVMGQAAGTAAALSVQHNTTPRGIYQSYLSELQQKLLKDDQYIIGLKNEDPADLARRATVTASSAMPGESFGKADVDENGKLHKLTCDRAMMFKRGASPQIKSVSVLVESRKGTELTLHLRGATKMGYFTSKTDLAVSKAKVPTSGKMWVTFGVNCSVEDEYAWFMIPATPGASLVMFEGGPLGSVRAYRQPHDKKWHPNGRQCYAFYLDQPIVQPGAFMPENVISGMARVVGDKMNMWASDPAQFMPQWIELDLGDRKKFNTVCLTFDTDLNDKKHCATLPPGKSDRFVPECVRDYQVQVFNGSKWETVAEVSNNYQRRRIHRFDKVKASRVRVMVEKTNGDPSARIFEIRLYDE